MSTEVKGMAPKQEPTGRYNWLDEYQITPRGFSPDSSLECFGEDTPHKPPMIDVDVKLAADIHIISDEEFAKEVAQWWFPGYTERYVEVAAVIFNDASVWYLPLSTWDDDLEKTRLRLVDEFVPDVIQWKAILNGKNPRKALREWEDKQEPDVYEWEERMDETTISEENRKWFNQHLDHTTHIDREIKSQTNEQELEVEDDMDWTEDW